MKNPIAELLGDEGAGAPECPDANLLAAFAERTLAGEELCWMRSHLAECGRCRQEAIFASIPDASASTVEEVSVKVAHTGKRDRLQRAPMPPSRVIGLRVAVKNAIGALEAVFEGSFDVAALHQPAAVFRGAAPEIEGVSSVVLGPYRLSLKRVEEGPKAGLYVRVTKTAGMPLTEAAAEIELESGRHVSGTTDKLGWVHIAGIALEHISAIWIHAAA